MYCRLSAPAKRSSDTEVEAGGQKPADAEAIGQRPTNAEGQRSESQRGPESGSGSPGLARSVPELEDR